MKKNWDNPTEHAMPERVRVPASLQIGSAAIAPGDGTGADGRCDGYGISPIHYVTRVCFVMALDRKMHRPIFPTSLKPA